MTTDRRTQQIKSWRIFNKYLKIKCVFTFLSQNRMHKREKRDEGGGAEENELKL